jgi:predicted type IV restriction endonuclease
MNIEITLKDIKEKLGANLFKNEEHIRLSLVCRLLQELGWNIWDPKEVNTEFKTIPSEDNKRVDIALFANNSNPSVYIEIKACGKIKNNLGSIERQLRDYNRDNTAEFSIITDGNEWYFYYPQTVGEFHQKNFKTINLLNDDIEDISSTFTSFLEKENIKNMNALEKAKQYLRLNKKQKDIKNSLPEARRIILAPPFPSLPKAIQQLLSKLGTEVNEKEIIEMIEIVEENNKEIPQPITEEKYNILDPFNPGDLTFSNVKGHICEQYGKNWKTLAKLAIKIALDKNISIDELRNIKTSINIVNEVKTSNGFTPIDGYNCSYQCKDANSSEKILLAIAKKLKCKLRLEITWVKKNNKKGRIEWTP